MLRSAVCVGDAGSSWTGRATIGGGVLAQDAAVKPAIDRTSARNDPIARTRNRSPFAVRAGAFMALEIAHGERPHHRQRTAPWGGTVLEPVELVNFAPQACVIAVTFRYHATFRHKRCYCGTRFREEPAYA